MYKPDVIDMVLNSIRAACPDFPESVASKVEIEARREYGGCEPYIRTRPNRGEVSGGDVRMIMRAHNVSRRTAYRIRNN